MRCVLLVLCKIRSLTWHTCRGKNATLAWRLRIDTCGKMMAKYRVNLLRETTLQNLVVGQPVETWQPAPQLWLPV